MTPEEKQMLTDLANKVSQTPAPQIDPEAQELIRTRIGSRPEALYMMTQTVLIQNMALEQAQQQIQQLKQNPPAAAPSQGSTSFLGSLFGKHDAPSGNVQGQPAAQPQSYSQPQQAAAPQQGGVFSSGGSSGFLRGAAQTAAGVAAGALAFEGIRSMFGGLEHMGGYGGGYGSGLMGGGGYGGGYGNAPVEETVVNNYYDNNNQGNDGSDIQDTSQNYDNSNDVQADDVSYDNNDNFDNSDNNDDSLV